MRLTTSDSRWSTLGRGALITLFGILGLSLITLILSGVWGRDMTKLPYAPPSGKPSNALVFLHLSNLVDQNWHVFRWQAPCLLRWHHAIHYPFLGNFGYRPGIRGIPLTGPRSDIVNHLTLRLDHPIQHLDAMRNDRSECGWELQWIRMVSQCPALWSWFHVKIHDWGHRNCESIHWSCCCCGRFCLHGPCGGLCCQGQESCEDRLAIQ